jgi:cytochrome b6-f complex iron-sulfur subunit
MSERKEKANISRQQFLGVAWFGAIAVLFGEFFAGLFKFIQPNLEGSFGGKISAGLVEDFLPGSVSFVQAGRFYLVRHEDGGFIAYWQRCTHLGCSVPYEKELAEFRCPCHGSVFDKQTGEVKGGPAPRPMDIFPIEFIDGEIFVDTGNPQQRKGYSIDQVKHI